MTAEPMMLNAKHVVITGASSGLGEALALELAGHGARLTLLARRQDRLDAVAQEVRKRGGEAWAASTDVKCRNSVESAIAQAVEKFGPVDVLIANSGISLGMSSRDLNIEAVEETMRVNYFGVVYAVTAVLPSMMERQTGTVMVISSLAASRGLPNIGPYCASKAAVSKWIESLRPELAPLGVRLITSHPGYIDTPMTQVNRYHMPFLVKVDDAARMLVGGMLKGATEINFPWQAVLLTKLGGIVPSSLYDRAMSDKTGVSWRTAALDAILWLVGGIGACVALWLWLRSQTSPAAVTMRTVFPLALPLLGLAVLALSRRLRGSTKVPILIVLLGIPLAIVAALAYAIWF